MATTDKDKSAETTEAKTTEEARANAQKYLAQRREEDPRFGGFDAGASDLGWTVQQGAQPESPDLIPGAVFVEDELPIPEVQEAAGINPSQANAGLVVAGSEEERAKMRGADTPNVALASPELYGANPDEKDPKGVDRKAEIQRAVDKTRARTDFVFDHSAHKSDAGTAVSTDVSTGTNAETTHKPSAAKNAAKDEKRN